ncbi:MAG: hypothetical protein EZS28_044336, partial [Streblomastix strix]
SPISFIAEGIIPDLEHATQTGNKIIHSSNNTKNASVAFNPVISEGIIRFEGYFENHGHYKFIFGVADSSAVFGADEWPFDSENEKKTVRYLNDGRISHIGDDFIKGNSQIEENKSIAMEVNMNIIPRTLTFFYDNQEQRLSVANIPSQIRFYIYIANEMSSFTITRFERIKSSSAKGGIKGQRIVEWGKEWKN